MPVTNVLLITLAAIFALGFVFFKYFLGNKNPGQSTYILAGLRFFTIFILLLLLINPGFKQLELEIEKPGLLIAVDGSSSIAHLEKGDSVQQMANVLQEHPELKERFNIQTYTFGQEIRKVNQNEDIDFKASQTNISSALRDLEHLNRTSQTALVLLTDGNQTLGEDYSYFKNRGNIGVFPVVVGDTTAQTDFYISNLNVNRYAFLNNNFPVETIVNYSGKQELETRFEIRQGTTVLYSRNIKLSPENSSEVISTTLPATRLGRTVYEAVVVPVTEETNVLNNSRKFVVEVIDERTSVLILSSILHPDLGALKKAIESNEQREVSIVTIKDFQINKLSDFQLIIIYQPNDSFIPVFEEIRNNNHSSWIITGTQTNWNFLNAAQENFSRNASSQTQDFFGTYNPNYSGFQFEDLEFDKLPPLEDRFGNMQFGGTPFSALLYQKVEGVDTKDPLLAVFENNTAKQAALFGENIWKWRAQSYLETGTFENFDNFISKLVQFLANTQKKERLSVNLEPVYLQGENLQIEALYFDRNYVFDPSGQLEIKLENQESGELVAGAMLASANRYVFEIDNLVPGEYSYEIKEIKSRILKRGNFIVIENNIEQQFTSANISAMKNLAENNAASLYFLNDPESLIKRLMTEDVYVSVQKSREKTLPLINWKILLFFLVLSLAAEWFMRKYFGLI
ncbi:VWA domain-containing protein [Antarcticibacterium arcticum]|uniref:VWA domain-containing protein n=1 Tax=Antarcticibacterium arcticum TaxID=2585771 RepID=A0A5B8YJ51_9FLAO|nr:VWA domain-containing protein [Antarcticibacterium arcticum]QED36867.1 VWA domain-containing protein [Antarcticibacterium arcticum]